MDKDIVQLEKTRQLYGPETALVQKIILDCGFDETGIIPVEDLQFYPDVRKICEQNKCRCYGTTWACPPAVGTLSECEERVGGYRLMHRNMRK